MFKQPEIVRMLYIWQSIDYGTVIVTVSWQRLQTSYGEIISKTYVLTVREWAS